MSLFLCGCWGFQEGSLDDADVFHWENETVTMSQFVRDHKHCLGAPERATRPNRIQKFLLPNKPYTIAKWDSLWATFESRQYGETGQRISLSIPSQGGYDSPNSYRRCMIRKGYLLIGYSR
ncbi:MAG: hypothetical protein JXR30_00240 [Alphaproteobacteria bacterium]|nr:hypothetical protein [Alphaproteobacteria bacterium]